MVKEGYHRRKYFEEVRNTVKENFGEEPLSDRYCIVILMKKFERTGNEQHRPRSNRRVELCFQAALPATAKIS